jgi:TolA-binding protein
MPVVSRARATALIAAVVLLGGGCTANGWKGPVVSGRIPPTAPASAVAEPPPPAPTLGPPSRMADPVHLVTRGDELARDGMPLAARDLYERVIRDYPEHPVRAGALFGLGQLQADSAGPLRDYRGAYLTFGRVLGEHPRSRWEADARLWRGVLNELLARDDESHRLRVQLQKLRRIEVDLDKAR